MLSDKRIREIDYWAGTYWSYSWKAAWAVLSVFLMVPIFWFFWGGIPVAAWATLGFYAIPACIGLCIHRLLYRRRMRVIHGVLMHGQPVLARVVEFSLCPYSEHRWKIVTECENQPQWVRTTHSLMAWEGMKEFQTGDEVTLLSAGSHALIAEYFVEVPTGEP